MGLNINNNIKRSIIIIIVVIIIVIIGFICLQSSGNSNNTKSEDTKKEVSYVVNTRYVELDENISTFASNEKCNKSSIKRRFSLKIQDGKILVNNIDTMENFVIDKINDPTNIITLSYNDKCDENRYVIVNREGLVFFTNNKINLIKDVKKIEEQFYVLNTDLRFESIILGKEKGKTNLYGRTASNNLYKINLR